MGKINLGKPERADRSVTDPRNKTPAKFSDIIGSAMVQDTFMSRVPGMTLELGDTRTFFEKVFGKPASRYAISTPGRTVLDSTHVAPANELQRTIGHEFGHQEDFITGGPLGQLKDLLQRTGALIADMAPGPNTHIYNVPSEKRARRYAEASQIIRESSPHLPLSTQFKIERNPDYDPDKLSMAVRDQALRYFTADHPIHAAIAQQDSLRARQGKPSQSLSITRFK